MSNHLKEIEQFDSSLSKIIGKQLNRVFYYEPILDELSFDFKDYHQLGIGVSMQLDTEEFYIIWNDQYVQFDIKFGFGSLAQEFKLENVAINNLTDDSNWHPSIGQKISEAHSFWNWRQDLKTLKKTYYPKDIKLKFESGQSVFFSCTRIEHGDFISASDEITIFFNETMAKKYGVGVINTAFR